MLSSLAALAVVLSAAAYVGFIEPSGPRQVLPDGSTLELLGATYGLHHEIALGNWWWRTIGEPIYAHLNPWIGLRAPGTPTHPIRFEGCRAIYETSSQVPSVWIRVRASGPDNVAELHLTTRDSHGCTLSVPGEDGSGGTTISEPYDGRMNSVTPPGRPSESLAVAALPVFPRREPRFQLNIADDNAQSVAHFSILNPVPPATGTWTGRPCPVSATRYGTTFTLATLRRVPNATSGDRVDAQFLCTEQGKPTECWGLQSMVVSDATGNTLSNWDYLGRGVYRLPALCSRERCWKLDARFAPVFPRQRPDFVWNLRGLPAPASGQTARCLRTARFDDTQIELVSVRGPVKHRDHPETGRLSLEAKAPADLQITILSVSDDRGRPLNWRDDVLPDLAMPFDLMTQHGTQDLGIRTFGSGRRFNVALAVNRIRHVQFLVRP